MEQKEAKIIDVNLLTREYDATITLTIQLPSGEKRTTIQEGAIENLISKYGFTTTRPDVYDTKSMYERKCIVEKENNLYKFVSYI